MAKFKVDNQIIHYEAVGSSDFEQKTPILMLHGNGEDMHIYDKVISRFGDSECFVLMDSRLHGESEPTEEGSRHLSYERMADDAIELMKHLGIHEYNIVGYSDGGIIALIMAKKTYDVSKVIAIGVNAIHGGLTPAALRNIKSAYGKAKRKHREMLMEYNRLMLEEPNITLSDLSRIVAEVTILLGAKDKFIIRKHSESIADALPHCSHVLVPDAGHDIPETHPQLLSDYIRTLL